MDQDEATYSEKLVGPAKSFRNNFLKHRLTGLSKMPIITTTASTTYETRNMLRRTTTLAASSRPTKTIRKLHVSVVSKKPNYFNISSLFLRENQKKKH